MNRRVRSVAGLLGLLALSASFAEAVLASTCATSAMMPDPAHSAAMAVDGQHGSPTAAVGAAERRSAESMALRVSANESDPATSERDVSARTSDEHRCPFESPLAAQACLGVVSLPARSAPLPVHRSYGPMRELAVAVRAGLLPDGALFRPPRA